MKLKYLLQKNAWFVENDQSWYCIPDDSNISTAASALPLFVVDEHAHEAQPHIAGVAHIASEQTTDTARLFGRSQKICSVRVTLKEPDGAIVADELITLDADRLSSVEWLTPRFRDGWTNATTSLVLDNVQQAELTAFLPPAPGSNGKTLVVYNETAGTSKKIWLDRKKNNVVPLLEDGERGTVVLRLECKSENIDSARDSRQLGFVYTGESHTGVKADSVSAGGLVSSTPRHLRSALDGYNIKLERMDRNLRRLATEASTHSVNEAARAKKLVAEARIDARAAAKHDNTSRQPKRGRAAVVAWDIGHNPVGRAYVLYQLLEKEWDVDLIGPMWSRYGDDVWEPLRNDNLNIRSFKCSTLTDFVPKAEILAAATLYDIVYVCKPRLPSLYLGSLIKDSSNCPMVLDVDDFELSFFKDESTASLDEISAQMQSALHEPFEELGTRYAQSLIPAADAVTVSNVALRERFGGHIVRHARDEAEFINSNERRRAARERLGIADSDFALIFIGTPRPHKGVLEVARALEEINDASLVFHIVGDIGDKHLREKLQNHNARVVLHPNCAFNELPDLLAGADLVPLIQDIEHAISQYQIPAKVSDALSLGVPVLATRTPPLADLITAGAVHETDSAGLADAIRELRSKIGTGDISGRARRDFVNELGLTVNRARLGLAIDEAVQCMHDRTSPAIDTALEQVAVFPAHDRRDVDIEKRDYGDERLAPAYTDFVALMRQAYQAARRREILLPDTEVSDDLVSNIESIKATLPTRFPAIISERASSYDIAFFWKQNDSGLYGRRSDMVARYLLESGRVDRLLHIDAPKVAPALAGQFMHGQFQHDEQNDLVMQNLVDRQMGIHDTDQMRARTFVGSSRAKCGRLLGQPIYKTDAYVRFIHEQLEEAGMRASNTVAWFCPIIWDASELITKVGFGGVVSDLIDDQRGWDSTDKFRNRLEASYRDTLKASDLVFANCDALAEAMSEYASNIHVVQNGAERFSEFPATSVPVSLKDIQGPIAGYVGNLRDRIDWMLLHQVVIAMPDVSFVFYGPSGDTPNAESLAKHANVHMLGVAPYAQLHNHLRAFDVGLVPHLNNRLTERMNPLKVYNYFAAGLPIVSTEVGNLADLGSGLRTCTNADTMVSAIRSALDAQPDKASSEWQRTMDSIAWDTRVANMLTIMDRSLRGPVQKAA